MNKIESLTDEQRKSLLDLNVILSNSKFKDPSNPPTTKEVALRYGKNMSELYKPDAYDFNNPETTYRELWHQYILSAALHGMPMNKKQTKYRNTTKERSKYLRQIEKFSGEQPSTEYLKEKFQLSSEFNEICEVIDEDIKSLS